MAQVIEVIERKKTFVIMTDYPLGCRFFRKLRKDVCATGLFSGKRNAIYPLGRYLRVVWRRMFFSAAICGRLFRGHAPENIAIARSFSGVMPRFFMVCPADALRGFPDFGKNGSAPVLPFR